jgi:hypothetical protein
MALINSERSFWMIEKVHTEKTILETLARIGRLGVSELRDQWRALFGSEPPSAYGKAQLVHRLSWRIQELHYGGLSEHAKQRMQKIAGSDELASGRKRPPKRKRSVMAPGTRLVRHWRGVEHVVTALAGGGLEWNKKRYRTLSAVAKAITGQHCSGPRFFGLVSMRKEDS